MSAHRAPREAIPHHLLYILLQRSGITIVCFSDIMALLREFEVDFGRVAYPTPRSSPAFDNGTRSVRRIQVHFKIPQHSLARLSSIPTMPSLCSFDTVIITMSQGRSVQLPEYDIHLRPSLHSATLTTNSPQTMDIPGEKSDIKISTSTCSCYVPSTPNQHFRVMVTNNSTTDACISVYVDGEWVYTGLSYPPLHKAIYFSGRLIDPNTIQEMRFTELDTTCTIIY